jgi:tetratricopeptide (TPR) repeat protein
MEESGPEESEKDLTELDNLTEGDSSLPENGKESPPEPEETRTEEASGEAEYSPEEEKAPAEQEELPAATGTESGDSETIQEPGANNSIEDVEGLEIKIPEDLFKDLDFSIPGINDTGTGDGSLHGFPLDAFDAFKVGGANDLDNKLEVEKYSLDTLEADLAFISESGGEIEEIQLSPEEFAKLQKTLASYPLNLRIVCEQIIAEEAVDPALMSKFIKALVQGASMREAALLAGKILERTIPIPKGFEKKSGEALEAEHARFAYIFVHKVVPVLRLFFMVALVAAALFYLIHRFVYIPLYANSIYKKGYDLIEAGDYGKAKERFSEALKLHRQKKWFYRYAEGFRDKRQYIDAEEKYDLLLLLYPQDKKGALDYAAMETNYLSNYAKADSILWRNILDYRIDDRDALLAVGDNGLAWGDVEPAQYEVARRAFARLLERYGWTSPVVERMMLYFIRTDNLKEVLPLQAYFMNNTSNKISPASLAELGGYLLDKRFEETRGVPNEYISHIDGIRDILIRAAKADPTLPEPHYHLARYYNNFRNAGDERITLERALKAFDTVQQESVRRLKFRIDAEQRYAHFLINDKAFFGAEEHLIKGIGLYEDGVNRRLLSRSPKFGRLYADLGDLEYFTKDGNMGTALEYYAQAEQNGWAPPEMRYRMGSAYYRQQQWASALLRFVEAASDMPFNRRLLNALGNAAYMRGNYAVAQGYYSRLRDILETERSRFSLLVPNERVDHLELAERLMMVWNNFGVTLEALTERTGDRKYHTEALGLYADSARAWDTLTRNPDTMIRMRPGELAAPGINLGYLNAQQAIHPTSDYDPQIYIQIDKDVLEPSPWEALTPENFSLSGGLF